MPVEEAILRAAASATLLTSSVGVGDAEGDENNEDGVPRMGTITNGTAMTDSKQTETSKAQHPATEQRYPRITNWSIQVHEDATHIAGQVYDKDGFENGTEIKTSSIKALKHPPESGTAGPVVITASSSNYELGLFNFATRTNIFAGTTYTGPDMFKPLFLSSPDGGGSQVLSNENNCAICLESANKGDGRALFDPGCGHLFHYNCIRRNFQADQPNAKLCPLCRKPMAEAPDSIVSQYESISGGSSSIPFTPRRRLSGRRRVGMFGLLSRQGTRNNSNYQSETFTDDDEVLPTQASHGSQAEPDFHLKMQSDVDKYTTMETDATVMVTLKALESDSGDAQTEEPQRDSGVDIVAVLDVSGSMNSDNKMSLLKETVTFFVTQLSEKDRLSIVTFNSHAHRITPLKKMDEEGKAVLTSAINDLSASGGTNIAGGFKLALRVLECRRSNNPVAALLLLTDGVDSTGLTRIPRQLLDKLRAVGATGHTFGYGDDHDASILNDVAEQTQGTFSFIEETTAVQPAFTGCLSNLTAVIAKGLQLKLTVEPGVRIKKVHTPYPHEEESSSTTIKMQDFYHSEQRDFLVDLKLPANGSKMKVMSAQLTFVSPNSGESHTENSIKLWVDRCEDFAEAAANIEISKQRNRLLAAAGIKFALELSESAGNNQEAVSHLKNLITKIKESPSAHMEFCKNLMNEINQCINRLQSSNVDRNSSRAYSMSLTSSLGYQRSSTISGSVLYRTPRSSLTMTRYQESSNATPSVGSTQRRRASLQQPSPQAPAASLHRVALDRAALEPHLRTTSVYMTSQRNPLAPVVASAPLTADVNRIIAQLPQVFAASGSSTVDSIDNASSIDDATESQPLSAGEKSANISKTNPPTPLVRPIRGTIGGSSQLVDGSRSVGEGDTCVTSYMEETLSPKIIESADGRQLFMSYV